MSTSTIRKPSGATTMPSSLQLFRGLVTRPSAGVVVLLLIITVVMAFRAPTFLTYGNWYNIVQQMVYVALLAVGMTIVLITGGIDLSVGSVLGLCAGVMASSINQGLPFFLSLVLALAAGACLGLINGLVITKLGIPDFIATLAMLGVASGLLFLWTGGVPFIGYMLPSYASLGGASRLVGDLTVPILSMILVSIVAAVVLRGSRFGRHLYGVGSNAHAARLSGVNIDRIRISAYVLSGTLAAFAGVLLAGRTTTVAPTTGAGYEIQAIAAAVIGGAALAGGRGRVLGAVLGALTITVAGNVINLANISATWQSVVVGMILLLAVVLDRAGLRLNRILLRTPQLAPPPEPASPLRQSAS